MKLTDLISRNQEIFASKLDDDVVMMDTESGKYYMLEDTAGVIWEKLEKPMTVEQLIDSLTKEYNVSRDVCEKDTLLYLEELKKRGLVCHGDVTD